MAATLAAGLREDSRIKMSMSGAKVSNEIWLLASAVDRLSVMIWQQTKDGMKGRNRPELITERLMAIDKESDIMTFNSGADFEAAWRSM